MNNVQYIVDSSGRPMSVVLPIDDYEELLEQLQEVDDPELVAAIEEARESPRVPLERLAELAEKPA